MKKTRLCREKKEITEKKCVEMREKYSELEKLKIKIIINKNEKQKSAKEKMN